MNLASVLGTSNAFVGFTAGTGAGYENQSVLNWAYTSDSATPPPVGGDLTSVPEPMSMALMGTGLLGLGFLRRRGA